MNLDTVKLTKPEFGNSGFFSFYLVIFRDVRKAPEKPSRARICRVNALKEDKYMG